MALPQIPQVDMKAELKKSLRDLLDAGINVTLAGKEGLPIHTVTVESQKAENRFVEVLDRYITLAARK